MHLRHVYYPLSSGLCESRQLFTSVCHTNPVKIASCTSYKPSFGGLLTQGSRLIVVSLPRFLQGRQNTILLHTSCTMPTQCVYIRFKWRTNDFCVTYITIKIVLWTTKHPLRFIGLNVARQVHYLFQVNTENLTPAFLLLFCKLT